MKRRGDDVGLEETKDFASRALILEVLLAAHEGEVDEGSAESSVEEDDDQFERDHGIVLRVCGGPLERIRQAETEEEIVAVFFK